MEGNELFKIWEEGNDELFKDTKTTKDMITQYLDKQTIKTSKLFIFNIVFYSFIQLTNIILCSMNIVAYDSNLIFKNVLIVMLLLSVGIMIYGIALYVKFREINNFSDSLFNLINKQLHFLKIKYEIWLVVISLSTLILIFNINIMVDYNDGFYPIHNMTLYIVINIVIFIFLYGTQKISSSRLLTSLTAYLTDLKTGGIEESLKLEKINKKYKWIAIALVIFFTIIMIVGLLKFI